MNKEALDLLTNEDICELYQQTNSNELFEYFFERNKNLMFKFVHKYINAHPEYEDDITNLATVGMWEAMTRYSREKETNFSTFYYYYCLKAVAKFYRQFNIIRIPAYKLQDTETLEKTKCCSLNTIIQNGDNDPSELIELHADKDVMTCDDYLEQDDNHTQLLKALDTLDGRTAQCIKWYLGLIDGHKRTLEEIGKYYGVTRERIRQIMVKGLTKLRRTIHKYLDTTGFTVDHGKNIHLSDSFGMEVTSVKKRRKIN